MQKFGYESALAFSQALQDYTAVHNWAVYNMLYSHIILRDGSSMAIARQEPRTDIFRIRLVCQTTPNTPRSQRNPATLFRVADHGFCPIARCYTGPAENAQSVSADMLRQSQKCHEDNLRSPTLDSYHYVGVLPVVYIIDDLSFSHTTMVSVFRPPNNVNMDTKAKTVLRDLARYCAYTMGTAFPIRGTDPERDHYAVPGRCIRSKGKQWTWVPLFDDWTDYYEGNGERLPGLEELRLPLLPPTLMNYWTIWWVVEAAVVEKLGIPKAYST
ncbi:hypothetical protein VTO73DRAFT_14247 [Trametes versicolor]